MIEAGERPGTQYLQCQVERHLHANGPWLYKLSWIYQEPEVTAAVERIAAVAQARRAACVYESYAR